MARGVLNAGVLWLLRGQPRGGGRQIARRLPLIMKQNARYQPMVQSGMVSGVAFVTAYEIENFHATANDDLPEPEFSDASSGSQSSPWARATGRLSGAFRRWVPQTLRRKAAA